MGLLGGGGTKKKIPNSRKKKGAIVKAKTAPAPVPEQAPAKSSVSVSPSQPSRSPAAAAAVTTKRPSATSSISVAERAKAFGAANEKVSQPSPPPIATKKQTKPASTGKTKPLTDTQKTIENEKANNSASDNNKNNNNKKFGLFGKGKSKEADSADTPSGKDGTKENDAKNDEPSKKKFGLFGKGKSKDTQKEVPTADVKPPESPILDKKKFGLFGKGKSNETEPETVKPSAPSANSSSGKENQPAPGKIGKLSMNALNLNIPGLGGKSRGTDTESKTITGKPPPQIDIYGETEQNPESQGQSQMSDRAKQTLVAPKDANHGKEDWKFFYELATQFDAYKQQEAEATKKQSQNKASAGDSGRAEPSSQPSSGDTKAIKNNLDNLFGGGGPGGGTTMNYNANGSFLNNKYFDQYLKEQSSGVALDFSNETSLYKRFCRKDQEQRTISEKFVTALLKHPKAKKITQLNMSSALLPDAFLVALCDQCLSGKGLPLLQVLNLESNDLTREGFEALAGCIASPKAWRRLQILKLENQKKEIAAGAEEVLGDAIVQSPSLVQVGLRMKGGIPKQQVANTVQANLDKLRVARRQHAAKKGKLKARKRNEMETLFDTIAANKDKKITEVDLTENLRFLGLDEAEKTKSAAAFATNKTVTKVTMTKLKLDDDFAEAFGKALAKNKTLETVVLDSNSFSVRGVRALLTGLGQNQSVTNFQIRHQSKTLASADEETLPALLANNTTLVTLGTDVRNPLIKSKLDRKMNDNREIQRKQRVAQKKR